MTDELSVQAVNDYQEKKGNYAVPGLVTGGAVGAAGGVAAAHYKNWGITQKPDLDKVFQQEADSFNGKIERSKDDVKTFYEKAKEQVQKVNEADKAYEAEIEKLMEQGEIKEADIPQDLKDARDKAKNDFDEAVRKKMNKRVGTTPTGQAEIVAYNPEFVQYP